MRKTIHFWVFLMVLYSCGASSETTIEIIGTPDLEIIAEFGVEPPKEIQYQFYQKYGFTDVVEQLIVVGGIGESTTVGRSNIRFGDLRMINPKPYSYDNPIEFRNVVDSQDDVLIEGRVFDKIDLQKLLFKIGDISVVKTDSTETITFIDRKNGVFYIESKKQK